MRRKFMEWMRGERELGDGWYTLPVAALAVVLVLESLLVW